MYVACELPKRAAVRGVVPSRECSITSRTVLNTFFGLLGRGGPSEVAMSSVAGATNVTEDAFCGRCRSVPSLVSTIRSGAVRSIFSVVRGFRPGGSQSVYDSCFLALYQCAVRGPFLSNLLDAPRNGSLFRGVLAVLRRCIARAASGSEPSERAGRRISCIVAYTVNDAVNILRG